jgi:hypothetical protein
MRTSVAASLLAVALVLAGAAFHFAPLVAAAFAEEAHEPDHAAHEGNRTRSGHGGHGGGAHAWSGGTGVVPTMQDALLTLERRQSIVIDGDAGFNPANGVRSGSGTYDDPFVISGWFVDQVLIKDTSEAFEFRGNYVGDILILDWTGKGGYVHHNHVNNLRTNRNVERTGDPSATVIEHNAILRVEELRHFDGEVRNNTIGRSDLLGSLLTGGVVFNIAGLNGAGIHDNVVFGGVDMKIHGHHHSDRPGLHSHNHGQPDEAQAEDHVEDHQVRYVDFHFYGNRIVDDGFGMRYNDLNHAGDDRQATSEQEPMLEKPHVHHTRVSLHDNVIEGATLRIAALNAVDERHLPGETATLDIHHNRILKPAAGDGLVVQDVRNATVRIHENVVEKGGAQLTGTSAILLQRFGNVTVEVGENALGDYRYGVRASAFDNLTQWTVHGNRAPGVKQEVYWDDSVANPPAGQAKDDHAGHEHSHGGEEDEALDARRVQTLMRSAAASGAWTPGSSRT